jgi:hypothetical protein
MNLQKVLQTEVARWESTKFDELRHMMFPHRYVIVTEGGADYCEIQLDLLEDSNEELHIGVSASDAKGIHPFLPPSMTFFVRPAHCAQSEP